MSLTSKLKYLDDIKIVNEINNNDTKSSNIKDEQMKFDR